MKNGKDGKDLWVLVADAHMAATVSTLLDERWKSLGIRKITYTIMKHLDHDPGCRRKAASTARSFIKTHSRALVVFDKHGSGDDESEREQIQYAVEEDLRKNGWDNRSKAIVIDPELEAWVWSTSEHVGKVLGWSEGTSVLRNWLHEHGLWPEEATKPPDPKSAMEQAMRKKQRPRTAVTFRQLAMLVGFKRCEDPAFREMRATLQEWFPATRA